MRMFLVALLAGQCRDLSLKLMFHIANRTIGWGPQKNTEKTMNIEIVLFSVFYIFLLYIAIYIE